MIPRSVNLFLLGFAVFAMLAGVTILVVQQWSPYRSFGVGGSFVMSDLEDRTVTDRDLLGRPTAIFFGFTFCPDVCPTTMLSLTSAMKKMGPVADKLNVVFVSVDPERDTPEALKQYLAFFDPRIRALTGTPRQVANMASAYRAYVRRSETEDEGYTIDHETSVMLFNSKGRIIGQIFHGEDENAFLAKLNTLAEPNVCRPGLPTTSNLWSSAGELAGGACR
jgi:protein SCO1/2